VATKTQKYLVMMRFGDSDSYHYDRGFFSKDDADTYVKLMMKNIGTSSASYYLFEQSKDYQHKEPEKKVKEKLTPLTYLDKIRLKI
tara:strand:+ start:497 stop:754 length:258 start_codon:yes stop_codon:yes gene_type:complete